MRVSGWIRRGAGLLLAAGVVAATLLVTTPAEAATSYKGKVIANGGLTIRSAPSTHTSNKGLVAKWTTITIACKVYGTSVSGNRLWYRLSNGKGWVAARYVVNIGAAPKYCPSAGTPSADGHPTEDVNVRSGPHFNDAKLHTLRKGTWISVICYVKSTVGVGGNYTWYLLADKGWVAAAYVEKVPMQHPWVPCA
jgi:uncharacterized protein YraI